MHERYESTYFQNTQPFRESVLWPDINKTKLVTIVFINSYLEMNYKEMDKDSSAYGVSWQKCH